ncbi:hypothetical protein EON65_52950 [archaeon]|nr:MAG: hypothetical protein EON65_52950 [archaeon]
MVGQKLIRDRYKARNATFTDRRMLVVTRIHGQNATTLPSVDAVIDFIRHVNNYADGTLVCIENSSVSERYERAIRNNSGHKVHVIQIKPWGYYTTALNMALQMAQDLGFPLIAFQVIHVLNMCKYPLHHVLMN